MFAAMVNENSPVVDQILQRAQRIGAISSFPIAIFSKKLESGLKASLGNEWLRARSNSVAGSYPVDLLATSVRAGSSRNVWRLFLGRRRACSGSRASYEN